MDYNCDLKTNLVVLNLPSCDYGNFMSINVLICFSEGGNILNELLNNINFGFAFHMKIRNLLVYNAWEICMIFIHNVLSVFSLANKELAQLNFGNQDNLLIC